MEVNPLITGLSVPAVPCLASGASLHLAPCKGDAISRGDDDGGATVFRVMMTLRWFDSPPEGVYCQGSFGLVVYTRRDVNVVTWR